MVFPYIQIAFNIALWKKTDIKQVSVDIYEDHVKLQILGGIGIGLYKIMTWAKLRM